MISLLLLVARLSWSAVGPSRVNEVNHPNIKKSFFLHISQEIHHFLINSEGIFRRDFDQRHEEEKPTTPTYSQALESQQKTLEGSRSTTEQKFNERRRLQHPTC